MAEGKDVLALASEVRVQAEAIKNLLSISYLMNDTDMEKIIKITDDHKKINSQINSPNNQTLDLSGINNQIDAIRKKIKEHDDEVTKMNNIYKNEIQNLQNNNKNLQDDNKNLQNDNKHLQDEFKKLNDKIDDASRLFGLIKNELTLTKKTQEEIEKLINNKDKIKQKITNLETTFDTEKDKPLDNVTTNAYLDQITKLENDLNGLLTDANKINNNNNNNNINNNNNNNINLPEPAPENTPRLDEQLAQEKYMSDNIKKEEAARIEAMRLIEQKQVEEQAARQKQKQKQEEEQAARQAQQESERQEVKRQEKEIQDAENRQEKQKQEADAETSRLTKQKQAEEDEQTNKNKVKELNDGVQKIAKIDATEKTEYKQNENVEILTLTELKMQKNPIDNYPIMLSTIKFTSNLAIDLRTSLKSKYEFIYNFLEILRKGSHDNDIENIKKSNNEDFIRKIKYEMNLRSGHKIYGTIIDLFGKIVNNDDMMKMNIDDQYASKYHNLLNAGLILINIFDNIIEEDLQIPKNVAIARKLNKDKIIHYNFNKIKNELSMDNKQSGNLIFSNIYEYYSKYRTIKHSYNESCPTNDFTHMSSISIKDKELINKNENIKIPDIECSLMFKETITYIRDGRTVFFLGFGNSGSGKSYTFFGKKPNTSDTGKEGLFLQLLEKLVRDYNAKVKISHIYELGTKAELKDFTSIDSVTNSDEYFKNPSILEFPMTEADELGIRDVLQNLIKLIESPFHADISSIITRAMETSAWSIRRKLLGKDAQFADTKLSSDQIIKLNKEVNDIIQNIKTSKGKQILLDLVKGDNSLSQLASLINSQLKLIKNIINNIQKRGKETTDKLPNMPSWYGFGKTITIFKSDNSGQIDTIGEDEAGKLTHVNIINQIKKINNLGSTKLGTDDDKTEFKNEILDLNNNITEYRKSQGRILKTTFNPESSRSHLIYRFEIETINTALNGTPIKGGLIVMDLAGEENVYEIISKSYNNLRTQKGYEESNLIKSSALTLKPIAKDDVSFIEAHEQHKQNFDDKFSEFKIISNSFSTDIQVNKKIGEDVYKLLNLFPLNLINKTDITPNDLAKNNNLKTFLNDITRLILQGFGYINPSLHIIKEYLNSLMYKNILDAAINKYAYIFSPDNSNFSNINNNAKQIYNELINLKKTKEDFFDNAKDTGVIKVIDELVGLTKSNEDYIQDSVNLEEKRMSAKFIILSNLRDDLDSFAEIKESFPLHEQELTGSKFTIFNEYNNIVNKIKNLITNLNKKETQPVPSSISSFGKGEVKTGGVNLAFSDNNVMIIIYMILLVLIIIIILIIFILFIKGYSCMQDHYRDLN